jgi:predicted ATPase
VRDIANSLIDISRNFNKVFIISTHSEHFVLALLSAVSKGILKPDDLSCYLCSKEKLESKFEQQKVNENGQLEGGLSTFMEGELEDFKEILSVSKKKKR